MRVSATNGLTALAVLALGCVLVPAAQASGKRDVIKACVEKRGGEARIVSPQSACRHDEIAVFWNVEGPEGDEGPAGPAGPAGATGLPGRDGRDGLDGRDGKDGRDGQDCSAGGGGPAGPIGIVEVEEVHTPGEPSPIQAATGGLTQEGNTGGGGGGGAGKVKFNEFMVAKKVDKSSPKIFMAVATGKHIKKVTIDIYRAGTTDVELNYTLEDVLISSQQQGQSAGDPIPTETVSFNFGKVSITFTPLSGPPETFCYDVKLNKSC